MYSMDFANIGDSLAYQTQQKIKQVFDALEAKYRATGEPSILFLDEIDAICGDRNKMHTDWKVDDVDAVLVQLNNAASRGIILIGATNRSEAMDKAAKRPGRFDQEIFVDYPTKEDRLDMITKLLKSKKPAKRLLPVVDKIVDMTDGCSYADIACLINTACRRAVINDKEYASFEDLPVLLQNILKKREGQSKIGIGV